MIGARLYGGLGNQMFQYAAARSLALRRGTRLWLDATWFREPDTTLAERQLLLTDLPVSARVIRHHWRLPMTHAPWTSSSRLRVVLSGCHIYERLPEGSRDFDPAVLSSPDRTLLDGYWQDERYFIDHANTIRRELYWSDTHDDAQIRELRRRLCSGPSIGMHVRRGDYVADARTAAFHGVLTPEYYRNGLDQLRRVVSEPTVYVFSDDPEWSRQNLDLDAPMVFVDSADRHPCVDLSLLRDCSHVVTANSSFSWWAAWLGDRPGRTVITPDVWFASDPSRHIGPPGWQRVSTGSR